MFKKFIVLIFLILPFIGNIGNCQTFNMQVTTANMATYVGSANWVLRSTVVSSANWVARSDSALYLQSTPNTLVTNNYTGIVTFKSPIILNNVTSSAVVSTGDINIAITVNGTLYYIKASRSL